MTRPSFLVVFVLCFQYLLAQEPLRFEVRVRTVYVDVFVTRDGESVKGLTVDDFEVLDNGVPQDMELMDVQSVPMSTMIVFDISTSVVGRTLDHLRGAAHAFLERLRDSDEAGLLTFTNEWQVMNKPGCDIATVHQALDRPMSGGLTALYDSLYAALKLTESRPGRPLVLLFTDGTDNASWLTEDELMEVARESDAVVHAVTIRSRAGVSFANRDVVRSPYFERNPGKASGMESPGESQADSGIRSIERIIEATGGRFWRADSSEELEDIYLSVLDDMESRYLLTYEPRGVSEQGWHTLEVKLKKSRADEIRARPGYRATR